MRIVSRQPNRSVPERMGALACLPVFFTLTGQRAVIIGGGEPARWKAELLAAAGARVEVFAPMEECCEEMLGLAAIARVCPYPPAVIPAKAGTQYRPATQFEHENSHISDARDAPQQEPSARRLLGPDFRRDDIGEVANTEHCPLHSAPFRGEVKRVPGLAREAPLPWGRGRPGEGAFNASAALATLTLIPRPWTAADLTGAAIAVADIEDEREAHAFVAAARTAGVPYNVIDKPELCQFQFGAIVNRSPLVVGISTAGAAPILGQAVRRRIETLLPRTLAAWADAAAKIRAEVMARLAPGPERRAFWERFTDMAFGAAPEADPQSLISRIEAEAPAGRVTLVGAGPGDAELLTIKAVRALQSADVILFDDLVSPDILELARREARRLAVDARGDIGVTASGFARQGKHVVRLVCGDPLAGERAGLEIAMLERQGLPVEVVPGVAAAPRVVARNPGNKVDEFA